MLPIWHEGPLDFPPSLGSTNHQASMPISQKTATVVHPLATPPNPDLRQSRGIITCIFLSVALTSSPLAAPGDLDLSFGSGGIVTTQVGPLSAGTAIEVIYDLVIQPNGKIVAVGSTYDGLDRNSAVVRYNPDGTLDSSFSEDGKVAMGLSPLNDEAYAVALQADGKIVVAGFVDTPPVGGAELVITRYNPDGTLDPAFSTDGIALPGAYAIGYDLIIQPDGKIVTIGGSPSGAVIVRLAPDGTLDASFSGGIVIFENRDARAGAILPNGDLVIGGHTTQGIVRHWVARFDASGNFKGETFTDVTGNPSPPNGRSIVRMATTGTGDAYTIGSSPGNVLLSRYNAGGAIDTTLGNGGLLTTPVESPRGVIWGGIVLQQDGKIIVAVQSLLLRYGADGVLDNSFSDDGLAELPPRSGASALALQRDRRIVVATGPSRSFTLTRLMGDGTPPTELNLDSSVIGENLPIDSLVGTLSAVDPDAEEPFQYSFVSGPGDGDNALFSVLGDQLLTAATFDFEVVSELSVRLRVTDGGGYTLDRTLLIEVADDTGEDFDGDGLTQAQEDAFGSSDLSTDSDGDGLGDSDEVNIHGSSPARADTDGDGLNDGDEVSFSYDPTNPDSDGDGTPDGLDDSDEDGLTAIEEIAAGSSPLKDDTDGDGLKDGVEVDLHGTDPSKPDTDGDLLTDPVEITTTKTNPLLADTDGNGTSDAEEDPDRDHYTNLQEVEIILTDPLDSTSHFTFVFAHSPTDHSISFTALTGREYRVERSLDVSDPSKWEEVISFVGSGSAVTVPLGLPFSQRWFYRVVVSID